MKGRPYDNLSKAHCQHPSLAQLAETLLGFTVQGIVPQPKTFRFVIRSSFSAVKVAVVVTQDLLRSSLLHHLQSLLRSLSAIYLQLKVFNFDSPDVAKWCRIAPEMAVIVDTTIALLPRFIREASNGSNSKRKTAVARHGLIWRSSVMDAHEISEPLASHRDMTLEAGLRKEVCVSL
jgi:hypothetical protein